MKFATIFAAFYIFVLSIFSSGWGTLESHHSLHGLLSIIAALALFGYSLRVENNAIRRLLILGSLTLFFGHLTGVFIQISSTASGLKGVFSLIPIISDALGFFFLLLAFEEAVK